MIDESNAFTMLNIGLALFFGATGTILGMWFSARAFEKALVRAKRNDWNED